MPAKSAKPERKTLTFSMPVILYPEGEVIGDIKRVHTYATRTTRFTPKDPYNLGSFDTFTAARDAMAEVWRAARKG